MRAIRRHLKDVMTNPMDDVLVEVPDDNYKEWIVTIDAASQDYFPYTGGRFVFKFKFGRSFSAQPPKIKCQTKIFHMNLTLGS